MFKEFCEEQGIWIQLMIPCAMLGNSVGECKHCTLLNLVRSIMAQTKLLISFGGYALLTIAYILSYVSSKSVSTTPYEWWYDKKLSLDHLYVWSLVGYIHNLIHKHRELSLRATKINVYPMCAKWYMMHGEHLKNGMMEINSDNADFLEDKFPSIGKRKRT